MTKIAVMLGSLRQDSWNKKLMHALEAAAPEGVEFMHIDIRMPLMNEDLEVNFPQEAQTAKEIIAQADGLLIVTPEYNRGIPGVLKNAIDWVSRPGLDKTSPLMRKPGGIAGCTPGTLSTGPAQAQLRSVLLHTGIILMGQPEIAFSAASEKFDDNGAPSEDLKPRLEKYMDEFIKWVDRHKEVA